MKRFRRLGAALLACVALLALAALHAQQKPASPTAESTRKMAELLRRIFVEQDWRTDPNKDAERAKYLQEELAQGPDLRTELKLRKAIAGEGCRN